jgi:hypothetical protein
MTISDEPRSQGTARLHEIAARLTETGWMTRLYRTRAGTDLTAALYPPGHRDIQVIADEDGYTELRYWAGLVSTPAAAVAAIADVLDGLMASRTLAERTGPAYGVVAGYDGAVTERAEGSGMAGPQDHQADEGRVPDQARPRAEDDPRDTHVRPDDLQTRLERLPPNHPSSPFRDDGSRKPPPPDLAQYELPLPDESSSPTDQELSDHPHTAPDGSWHWKGYHLTPEQTRGADQGLITSRNMEGRDAEGRYGDHGLTPTMRRIEAKLDHGQLIPDTERFALKDPDRYKEKFAKLAADEPGADVSDIVAKINDGVRYTYAFEDKDYTSGVQQLDRALASAGFELYERKNSWIDESKAYQGINSSWMDPEWGQLFEVQMHTPASWQAKQESHRAYEIAEAPDSSPEDRAAALSEQDRIFSRVPIPSYVQDIPSYRKEGW